MIFSWILLEIQLMTLLIWSKVFSLANLCCTSHLLARYRCQVIAIWLSTKLCACHIPVCSPDPKICSTQSPLFLIPLASCKGASRWEETGDVQESPTPVGALDARPLCWTAGGDLQHKDALNANLAHSLRGRYGDAQNRPHHLTELEHLLDEALGCVNGNGKAHA